MKHQNAESFAELLFAPGSGREFLEDEVKSERAHAALHRGGRRRGA